MKTAAIFHNDFQDIASGNFGPISLIFMSSAVTSQMNIEKIIFSPKRRIK